MTSDFAANGVPIQIIAAPQNGALVHGEPLDQPHPQSFLATTAHDALNIVNPPTVIDSSTFDQVMNNYYADCKYKIKKCWNPSSRIGTLRIDTHFRIHRNGDISDIKITRTSGAAADDLMAIQSIKRATPLARLPLGCPNYLDVDFVFEINFGSNRDPFQQAQNKLCPPRRKVMPSNDL